MDTKSKSSKKWLGNLICIGLVAAVAAGTMLFYPSIKQGADQVREGYRENSDEVSSDEYEKELLQDFINKAYVGAYGFYWNVKEEESQASLSPFSLFFPDYKGQRRTEEYYSSMTNEYYDTIGDYFDNNFEIWTEMYQTSMLENYGTIYQVVDEETGKSLSNGTEDISKKEPEDYAFYMKYQFDENGNWTLEKLVDKEGITEDAFEGLTLNKSYVLGQMDLGISAISMEAPKNITVYLVSSNEHCYYMGKSGTPDWMSTSDGMNYTVMQGGLSLVMLGALAILTAAALLLPCIKSLRVGSGFLGKFPFETVFCMAFLPAIMSEAIASMVAEGLYYVEDYYLYSSIGERGYYLMSFGIFAVVYGCWFVTVLSARQVFSMGLVRYVKEKVWCVVILRWIFRGIKRFGRWIWRKVRGFFRFCMVTLEDIDLTERSNRMILKVLGINFLIVFLCCFLWYFGVMALILYTVILFFILRRYADDIRKKYNILLSATRRMANGDLNVVEITEDTGIFEPLTEELNKVRIGFRKAVEEEMKSQNLKTELITNVSHDLKTPLTAIITYVDLLKNENITEEERKEYINILDRKSARLKQLIEDLFEVSKAASGNIKVEFRRLNLTELLKQAVFEMEDRLAEAGIECRISVPETDVIMELDGEKMYRCLENLLINISKYGLSGTRAYLNLTETKEAVDLVIKNISATELTMDMEELTERFIRGDKSRNTEGSGLGLAIVKSFVELQGGIFHVEADGDLFKAIIHFPRENQAEEG